MSHHINEGEQVATPLLEPGAACGERATPEEIRKAADFFEKQPLLRTFLDSTPTMVMVINDKRQIVFANRRVLKMLGCDKPESVCGLRPGEIFNCVHAHEAPAGCGTTEFCRTCGAVKAVLSSLINEQEVVEECRILRATNDALELRVGTKTLTIDGQHFTIFCATDVTHEKRRETLERLLFHDLLNLAGAIHGFCDYLAEASPEELDRVRGTILQLTNRLIHEIRSHQLLLAAERGDLHVAPGPVQSRWLVEQIAESFRQHPVAREREIVVDPASEDVEFITDPNILSRVLENMVKNALEAVGPGERVTIRCYRAGESIRFEVHNPGVMPHEVQLQIFVRSYSTKGKGRGLGTYAMKLFTEKYLGGRIDFESRPEIGTTFRVELPLQCPQQGTSD